MPIINPTEDQLNEWLAMQPGRSAYGGNRLAELALDPMQLQAMQQDNAIGGDTGVRYSMPQNYIQSSSGRTIPLQSIQEQGGMSLNDLLNKTGANIQDKVEIQGRGTGYRLPGGIVVGLDANGKPWEFGRDQPTLKDRMAQAQYESLLADLQNKQKPKYELVQTEQGMFRVEPSTGRASPITPEAAQQQPGSTGETAYGINGPVTPQQGAPQTAPFGAKTKPMTEDQSKATGYGVRAATSHEILNSIGENGKVQPGLLKRILSGIPASVGMERMGESVGTMTNWTQSDAEQQVEQAQRDFVNAILRRESGAVISQPEFENAAKQYFPQPGDSSAVIQQKKLNRENSIDALATGAGAGAAQVQGARKKMQMILEDRKRMIFEAQEAIKAGADKKAVRSRLEKMGITNHGL